jgi:pimeloyl-ACP methyl ester carboxylesterase
VPVASVGNARLEYQWIGERTVDAAPIVMLHEGLGSVSLWRDFPTHLSGVTHRAVLVYSREGYGHSSPMRGPRPVSYMHDEALIVLPGLLDQLDVHEPILFGHSDGASIALIHAGAGHRPVRALILLAPHVMVEDISVRGIAAARQAYEATDLRARLARHHDDVDAAFRGWNDIWLSPEFRQWNIEQYLPRVRCPVLAIQGEDDEYGTMAQIDKIASAAPDVELLKLERCGHSPHRDCPEAVLAGVEDFLRRRAL